MEQVPTRKELEHELSKIHTAFSHINENFTRLHRNKADTSLVKELQASLARYSVSQTQVNSGEFRCIQVYSGVFQCIPVNAGEFRFMQVNSG
jgi:hypothetical protein